MSLSSPIFYCIMSCATWKLVVGSTFICFFCLMEWSQVLLCFSLHVSHPAEECRGALGGRSLWKLQSRVGLCVQDLFLLLGQPDVGAHVPLGEGST